MQVRWRLSRNESPLVDDAVPPDGRMITRLSLAVPKANLMHLAAEGIVLYSEDLNRAKAFYQDLLGLPLLLDEGHVLHFDAGTVRLAIHRCPPGQRRETPEGFLVFGVEDLASVHEELVRRGATFLGPPANRPYGQVAYLHDPEGHEIGFLEEPRKGTEGHRRVAVLADRYERVLEKLAR